jgi:hypothetical protein
MAESKLNAYELLERNGLCLPPHMKKILTELGYCSVHTLSQVDTPEVLQETVVELFGNSTEYQNLPENEKKALLGPMYWGNPSKFKFLPGERASLISIKSLCTNSKSLCTNRCVQIRNRCVQIVVYKFDDQTKRTKKMSSTGTKLAVLVHAFHPFHSYICSLPPPTLPSCNKIVYPQNIVDDAAPLLSKLK